MCKMYRTNTETNETYSLEKKMNFSNFFLVYRPLYNFDIYIYVSRYHVLFLNFRKKKNIFYDKIDIYKINQFFPYMYI